jgi:hypothetical protein
MNTVIDRTEGKASTKKALQDDTLSKSTFYIDLPTKEDSLVEQDLLTNNLNLKYSSNIKNQASKIEYFKQISEGSSIKSSLPIMNQVLNFTYFGLINRVDFI